MSTLKIDTSGFEKLQQAMIDFEGDVEKEINEVLHEEASPLIQDAVKFFMPKSKGKKWKGKLPHAKDSKSLTDAKDNLSITVKSAKKYQYLYFPDDGTSTKHHAGNKQFFKRGGESQSDEIIDRCISRLVSDFENR